MKKKPNGVKIEGVLVANDGKSDASAGIQKILDSGVSPISIPEGTYLIEKGLKISGNTRLEVHPRAVLLFAPGAGKGVSDFLLSNKNPDTGDANIVLTGGIWDGNNKKNPRGPEGRRDSYTGALINIKNVDGFRMENMLLKDSTAYFTRFTRLKNFHIENIEFKQTRHTRNQDGIHCCGHCENGRIKNIRATGRYTTGDDLIALNADDGLLRSELLGAEAGPIRNLKISDLYAEDCHSFIRMASVWSEISDVDIRNVFGGCREFFFNADSLRYCRLPLFDRADPAYANGAGLLRNIRITNVEVYSSSRRGRPLFCLESRMDNFVLEDIRRDLKKDKTPRTPMVSIKHVAQAFLKAEYHLHRRYRKKLSPRALPLEGSEQWLKEELPGETVNQHKIHTDHLREFSVGKPLLDPLPPMDCMKGF